MLPFLHLFEISLPTYGLMIVVGILCGSLLFYFTTRSRGIDPLDSFILSSYTLIAAMLGAKLLSILTGLNFLLSSWREGRPDLFWGFILNGGMVFYGGVIAGLITFVLVAKHNKILLLAAMDCAAPALALGHFFGRLGCFAVGCCYGVPSDSCGLSFLHSPIAPNNIPLLPVQLYEAIFNLLLSMVLLAVFKRRKTGQSTAIYLLAYGSWRFLIEFWRGDAYRGFWLGLSTSQWLSMGLLALGAYILMLSFAKNKQNEETVNKVT